MNLSIIKKALIICLILYEQKHFSYSKLCKHFLMLSQRVLYYFLNKTVEKQKLFQLIVMITVKVLKITLRGGKLIIDNTTIDKSYSKSLEGASYVWDSRKGRSVYGYSLVLLIWVIYGIHIPIGYQLYVPGKTISGKFTKKGNPKRQRAPKTHSEIACELLSFARNRLKMKPESVHFDEFFTCFKILKLLNGYSWSAYFAVRSNNKFEGEKLNIRKWKSEPEWGKLGCGINITLMKDGKSYYGSNRYGLTRQKISKEWHNRWDIELNFRFLKSELYWECCKSTSKTVQENHLTLGLIAFLVIQLLAKELNQNWYQFKATANLNRVKIRKMVTKYSFG
jgi:putative transposase